MPSTLFTARQLKVSSVLAESALLAGSQVTCLIGPSKNPSDAFDLASFWIICSSEIFARSTCTLCSATFALR